MTPLQSRLQSRLATHHSKGLTRKRIIVNPFATQHSLDFCNNDYLGLAKHPDVISAFCNAAREYGVGGQSSPLIAGYTKAHAECETAFVNTLGFERAILFSSGYLANHAIMTYLLQKTDRLLLDRLNHASIIDAAVNSERTYTRYRHADIQHIAELLAQDPTALNVVMSDTVFSMDGDMLDLAKLVPIVQSADAVLIIDDAHGFGVLGKTGLGSLQHFNISPQDVTLCVIPMGKSIGCNGAIVLGNDLLIESCLQFAKPYTYSTAISPAICAAAKISLDIIKQGELTQTLQDVIHYFQQCASQLSIPILSSSTAVQGVMVGDNQGAHDLSLALQAQGFFVRAILPPTVAAGQARLRISLSVRHSRTDIERLMECLATLYCCSSVGVTSHVTE